MGSTLFLDVETYATVNLKKANVYAYVEDPTFEVLMCAWSLDGAPVQVTLGESAIREIPGLWDDSVTKVAHNAGFERVVFSTLRGLPVGEYLPPEPWFDTMALAAEHGLPRGLDALAKMLGAEEKDSAGTRLINLFSKPYRGRRVLGHERPKQWQEFIDYCRQDVETMIDVYNRLPAWPRGERALWNADQRVNDRGMVVDTTLARAAVTAAEENTERARREVIELTGVANPGSTAQLTQWCAENGHSMPDWTADTVEQALETAVDPTFRRVLECRQDLALVASRKYTSALLGVSTDGRLRGQFKFHGAHTGRWSSQGVQVHNLPRESHERESAAIWDVCNGFGADPDTLKRLVRPMFLGPFTISDFSAIEARVLAWLAGERWVLEAFAEDRDVYVETAERMGGGMGRPEGKVAVLAAGYQGSVGSFRNMGYGGRRCPFDVVRQQKTKDPRTGREYEHLLQSIAARRGDDPHLSAVAVADYLQKAQRRRIPLNEVEAAIAGHAAERARDENHRCDVEIKEIVTTWRQANSKIQSFWYDVESAFWTGGVVGRIIFEPRGTSRWVRLPSGRVLKYQQVHRQKVPRTDPETGEITGWTKQLAYRHIQGYVEKTYGGRLTENITQAVARDLLADALVRLDSAGYRIVSHVHDEVVVESDDVDGITAIMKTGPKWADGLPLNASGDLVPRYTK